MWFVRQDTSEWHRSEAAPKLIAAVIERSNEGKSILIAPCDAGIAVNGVPIMGGIHVLSHKDELSAPYCMVAYFSAEALPEVVSFSGPSAKCGRCRTPIEQNVKAVRCVCGVWYHHADPPCFEYGAACIACNRPTRLDGSGLWTPEADE